MNIMYMKILRKLFKKKKQTISDVEKKAHYI